MEWWRDTELFQLLRDRLRAERLGRGPWDGDPDLASEIARVLDSQLAREVARVIPDEVIQMASTLLADSQDARYQARTGEASRTIPGVLAAQEHTENSIVARILLEHAMRNRESGRRRIDAAVGHRLINLADQTWRAHIAADRARYGLSRIERIVLTRGGRVEFTVVDALPFRMSRFERMYVARMGSHRRNEDADPEVSARLVESMRSQGPVPAEVAGIDAGLRASRGHGLVEMLVALATLGQMAGGHDEKVVGVSLTEQGMLPAVMDHLRQAFPDHDPVVVTTAIPYLTWTQELLQETPTSIADYQQVPARLLSRPLMERPDHSYFVARTVPEIAMYTLVLRVLEGTWVENLGDSDRPLALALERRRNRIRPIDGFERDLAAVLQSTGLPYATSVLPGRPGDPARVGVPLRREIDAVVAVPTNCEIWVIEAKDLAIPFSARRIRSEVNKYQRKDGHFAKLAEKVQDVRADPNAVAASIGAPPSALSGARNVCYSGAVPRRVLRNE